MKAARSCLVFHRRWLGALLVGVSLGTGGPSIGSAAEPESKSPALAEIAVDGLGWWVNRQMRLALQRLLGEARGPTMRANAVEDAVFLLMAAIAEDGYLQPTIGTRITLEDGRVLEFEFDHELRTLLPRPMAATRLELEVDDGVRFLLKEVLVEGGDEAMDPEMARLYFGFGEGLLVGATDRVYNPSKARTSAGRLEDELRRRGFAEATVLQEVASRDDEKGEVVLQVKITLGPKWRIGEIQVPESTPPGVVWPNLDGGRAGVWHGGWQQDTAQTVRRAYYQAGYPDVRVRVEPMPGGIEGGSRQVDVKVDVESGPRISVGAVRFEGSLRTKESVLKRRVETESGEPLDPQKVEESRYRLARLGVFRRVDTEYMETAGTTRDIVFRLQDRPPWDASLLMGYGSYEQLRGGVEFSQNNLWGRAHRSRLQLVQSMKGSSGDYTYTVPELFGEQLDGSVRLFGLLREETAFERREYGGSVTLRRPVPWIGADGRVGYTYQSLQNSDNALTTREVDEERTTVASLDLGLSRDRRDNPLRPRRGYRWFGQAELASTSLGGEVDYQRFEMGGSYHTAWGRGRWIHVGLTHGVVLTLGADNDADLPINKRFYPGGESNIRGFQEGEAAPRGADGAFIGAKSYLLLNVEVEQALTKSWSAVVFFDAMGEAAQLADYPFDERLYSAGVGLRYQTLIGPVRLEYGHNLNPRPDDPSGTLHLSVGFPF